MNRKNILVLIALGAFMSVALLDLVQSDFSGAIKDPGLFDIADQKESNAKVFSLTGKWQFIPNVWITQPPAQTNDKTIQIPGSWQNIPTGSFYLKIKSMSLLKEHGGLTLALLVPNTTFAYKIYAYLPHSKQNIFLGGSGKVALDPLASLDIKKRDLYMLPLLPDTEDEIYILMTFSNHTLPNSDLEQEIMFGDSKILSRYFNRHLLLDFLTYGIVFMMALYAFSLFLFYNKDRSSMFLSHLCLIFILFDSSRRGNLPLILNENIRLSMNVTLEYVILALAPPLLLHYALSLFSGGFGYQNYKKIHLALSALLCIIVLVVPTGHLKTFLPIFQINLLLACAYFAFRVLVLAIYGHTIAQLSFLGILFIFLGLLNDIGSFYSTVPFPQILHICFLFFIFFQTQTIAYRASKAHHDLSVLTHNQTVEIENKTKELETNYQQITNLLRVILHDISNPLAIADGATERAIFKLSKGKIDEALTSMTKVRKACSIQIEILNSVKEMQTLRDGKRDLPLVAVNLNQCIAKIAFSFEEKLAAKNLQLKIDESLKEQDLMILAEPLSLFNNVLANLISNAIKFSPENATISIDVSTDDTHVTLDLRDQGIGIPAEILDHIFDHTKSTTRLGTIGEKGTGYGMPIAKAYMDMYKGQINIESKTAEQGSPEQGSKVRLTFLRA